MPRYVRCPECDGTGLHGTDECSVCEGYGGYWIVVDTSGGIEVRVIPGDADTKPEEPP